jgi:hypothetical protein
MKQCFTFTYFIRLETQGFTSVIQRTYGGVWASISKVRRGLLVTAVRGAKPRNSGEPFTRIPA